MAYRKTVPIVERSRLPIRTDPAPRRYEGLQGSQLHRSPECLIAERGIGKVEQPFDLGDRPVGASTGCPIPTEIPTRRLVGPNTPKIRETRSSARTEKFNDFIGLQNQKRRGFGGRE
ncbi:hypothetical protein RFM99_06290 [Mesorhizobium sp. VK4C]|uniref:hypothetical protein n=1 Tax=Mesorhizobium captivum TaxID=3072319 RepID=UPI002A24D675|nr:hypothetical protein [Mesorhizobium sp. VK4C]MDX8498023.1 hypothetical protein [Mesorhizobium sp. VK4C]